MRWDTLFTMPTLLEGKDLFRSNRIKSFKYNIRTHSYTANFVDRYNVSSVSVTLKNGEPATWYCSGCTPRRLHSSQCVHLAGLLYAVDSDVKLHPEHLNMEATPSLIPFNLESDGYHYFNIQKIAKSTYVDPRLNSKALNLYNRGSIILTNFQLIYDRFSAESKQNALVYFRLNTEFEATMIADISSDKLLSFECHHHGCNPVNTQNRKLCVHGQAALMLLRDYIDENDPGDSTDQNASDLIADLRRLAVKTAGENIPSGNTEHVGRSIQLVPRLEGFSDKVDLSFKIGASKLYVLRSISKLNDCFNSKSTFPLGKSQAIDFSTDSFDDKSKQLFTLIQTAIGDLSSRSFNDHPEFRFYQPRTQTITSYIDLSGHLLDDFFDMYNGDFVEFTNLETDSKPEPIILTESTPNLSLRLEAVRDKANNRITGFALRGQLPNFYRGARFCYVPVDAALHRIPSASGEILKMLYAVSDSQTLDLTIGLKHFPEFYHSLLPLLRDIFTIEEPSEADLEGIMPLMLQLSFYLNRENGLYTCRAETTYGEKTGLLKPAMYKNKNAYADSIAETRACQTISRYFPDYDDKCALFTCPDTDDNTFELLTRGMNALQELGNVNVSDAFSRTKVRKSPKVSMGVSLESNLLNLTVDSGDINREELLQLLDSYRAKKRWHKLNNGDFVELDQNIGEMADIASAIDLDPKKFKKGTIQLPAYRALYLDKLLEGCENVYTHRDSKFRTLARNFKTVSDSDYDVPASLEQLLRPYQVYGYKWMRTLADSGFGGILADDMGLGKTLQAITVLLSEKESGTKGTSLVVCPASLVYNWKEEFTRFAPSLNIGLLNGQKQEREALLKSWQDYDVIVTSYGILTRDIHLLENISFLYEIIDEAQFIKTHTTTASKAVRAVSAKHRFALTGTPIENRLSELWSIFDYLMPGYLYDYPKFKKTLETPIVRDKNTECSNRLRRMVAPFILRRLKTEVLKDLPEKMEEIRRAVLEGEQKKLYDAQALRIRNLLEDTTDDEFSKNKLAILSELMRLRRICCDPSLTFEDYAGPSAKRDAVMDLLHTAIEGGHRVLLFSQFTSMLDLLESDLNANDIAYLRLDGSIDKKKRVEMMHTFNDGDIPVFLISLKAGGTGLNLTGADIVIHYDPWWNPAVENQASDRVYRIGQTKPVTVYRLIAKDTIEESILQLQSAKKELADAILAGDNNGITQFSREDLIALLEEKQ